MIRTITALVLTASVLAGCSSGSDDPADAETGPASQGPVGDYEDPQLQGWADRANGAEGKDFLIEVAAINPGLDDPRSLRRAITTCDSLAEGTADLTKERYSGGSTGDLTDDDAAKILAAAKRYICPDV